MGFKKNDDPFSKDIKFTDQLKGVFIEEAGRFTGEGNEAASADIDQGAETLLRLSAEKNKKRREAIKAEIRNAGLDHRSETKKKHSADAEEDREENNDEAEGTDSVNDESNEVGDAPASDISAEGTEIDADDVDQAADDAINGKEAAYASCQKRQEESSAADDFAEIDDFDEIDEIDESDEIDELLDADEFDEEDEIDEFQDEGDFDDFDVPDGVEDNEEPDNPADYDSGYSDPARAETDEEEVEPDTSDEFTEEDDFKDEANDGTFKSSDSFSDAKDLKKQEQKERRKGAAKVTAAKVLHAKRDISNDFAGNYEATGDAMRDGSRGLTGCILTAINPMTYIKQYIASLLAALAPTAASVATVMAVVLVIAAILFSVLQPIADASGAVSGFLSIFTVNTDTFTNVSMSASRIDEIVAESGCDEEQEKVLRYALSKVGYPYSQPERSSGHAYDCSSLAYYSWRNAGVDISYGEGYAPTAAAGAWLLKNDNKTVPTSGGVVFSMKPGDLVYYGGSDNGRFMGIYHVAIYVGNGMAVEALNTKYGVVYQSLRTNKVCMVCRPG